MRSNYQKGFIYHKIYIALKLRERMPKMVSVRNWIAGACLAVAAGIYGYGQPIYPQPLWSAVAYAAPVLGIVSFLLVGADSISRYLDKQYAEFGKLAKNHAVHVLRDEVVKPIVILSILHSKDIRNMTVEDIAEAEAKAKLILKTLEPEKE